MTRRRALFALALLPFLQGPLGAGLRASPASAATADVPTVQAECTPQGGLQVTGYNWINRSDTSIQLQLSQAGGAPNEYFPSSAGYYPFTPPGTPTPSPNPTAYLSWQVTITPALRAPGSYLLVATAYGIATTTGRPAAVPGQVARTQVQLPCLQPTPSPTFTPKLVLSPVVGPPGTVTLVVGTGFRPGTQVVVSWNPGINLNPLSTVVADATGGFQLQVLVYPHDQLGPRKLEAVNGPSSPSDPFNLTADFAVTPGMAQPRDFAWRR